jgi:alkylhydroperoxidase family enzyme
MARISLDPPRTLVNRLVDAYSRHAYGRVAQPSRAMGHHRAVLVTTARHEMSLARWKQLDETPKALAVMVAAATIGCSWCMDFGYWISAERGVAPAKLRDVPRWRDSDVYTDLERRVMAYAEAASLTPTTVTDEMVAQLRRDLGEPALVELTMMIAVENQRSRFNSALGLTSQGFRDTCEVPAARPGAEGLSVA